MTFRRPSFSVKKPVAVLTAATVLFSSVAAPWAGARALPETAAAPVALPPDAARVSDAFWPRLPVSPEHPLVIHVQDVHGLYEAQKNLAAALSSLARASTDGRPLLVAVEGAWGPLDLRWLKVYPDASRRDKTADLLMGAGLLTGEEFAAVTDDGATFALVGVEDPGLHRANAAAREASRRDRETAAAHFRALQSRLAPLKNNFYPPSARRWSGLRAALRRNDLSLGDYLEDLHRLSSWKTSEFPVTTRVLRLFRAEKNDDSAALGREIRTLLEALETKLPAAEKTSLAQAAEKARRPGEDPGPLYENLHHWAARLGISAPALNRRADNAADGAAVDPATLSRELRRLEEETARRLLPPGSPAENIYALEKRLEALLTLCALELTPEDWREIQAHRPAALWRNAEADIAALERKAALDPVPTPAASPKMLLSAETAARRFYTLALARNAPLVENALAQARKHGADRVVLIAGGFHTPGITAILRRKGLSHLVSAPRFTLQTLRDLSRTQNRDGARILSAPFPPDPAWTDRLTGTEREKLKGVQWTEIARGDGTLKIGSLKSDAGPIPLLLELDAAGNPVAYRAGEKDVAARLRALGLPPPAPARKTPPPADRLRRWSENILIAAATLWDSWTILGVLWNAFQPHAAVPPTLLQAGGLFFVTPLLAALLKKSPEKPASALKETVDLLSESVKEADPETGRKKLKAFETSLRKTQARDDLFSGQVYDALTGDDAEDPESLKNSAEFNRLLAEGDPRMIGRMLAGRALLDRRRSEEFLRSRLRALLDKQKQLETSLKNGPLDPDSATEIVDFVLDDLSQEESHWDAAALAPGLSPDKLAAIKNLRESFPGVDEIDFLELEKKKSPPAPDFAPRLQAFLRERIYRADRRLRALTFPETLLHDREAEELRSDAGFLAGAYKRQWALETVMDGLPLDAEEREIRKEVIWQAFDAAQKIDEKTKNFPAAPLQDLTAQLDQRPNEEPSLSAPAREALASALKEESPFQSLGLRAENEAAKKAAAFHLTRWGKEDGGGKKLYFVDFNQFSVDPTAALEEWRILVKRAAAMGMTGFAVDMGTVLARYPKDTDLFVTELLAPLAVPGNPVPFLALATEEEDDRLMELQKKTGKKFYEAVVKRTSLLPKENGLPALREKARELLPKFAVELAPKDEAPLLGGLLKDLEDVRYPGGPAAYAQKILEDAALAVRQAFVEGRRDDAVLTREDLRRALEAAPPVQEISSLAEKVRDLLKENPPDVQGMDSAVRARVENFLADLSSREKRGELGTSHDEDVNKKVAYLDNFLRLFGRRLPPPFPELAALEGLSREEIEKKEKDVIQNIIGRASLVMDRSHYGMWRAKKTVLRALRVRLNQQLSALKEGKKLSDADLPGLNIAFLGPPGGGKTSLGIAIASALGLPFQFVSAAGFQDLNTVRGTAYTFQNSGPGALIQALQTSRLWGLLFIDEVDKASPEVQKDLIAIRQGTIHDAYFGDYPVRPLNTAVSINFQDKAKAFLETEGMIVIDVPGYSRADKARMAASHLLPRLRRKLRLPETLIPFPNPLRQFDRMAAYTPKPGFREFAQMTTRRLLRALDLKLRTGAPAAPVREDTLIEEEGLPPQTVRAEEMPRVGRTTALKRVEEGAEAGPVDAIILEEPGAGILPLEVMDLRGQVTRVMADLARLLSLRKFLLWGGDAEALEGKKLLMGAPRSAGMADSPSLGAALTSSAIAAARNLPVFPDVSVIAEITETEELRPVEDLTSLLMAAEPAGVKTVLLPRANRPHLEDGFSDVPALRGPVEEDGIRALTFENEDVLEEESRKNPEKVQDAGRRNAFNRWVADFAKAAGGPAAETSPARITIQDTPSGMEAWMELLVELAGQINVVMEEGTPETFSLSFKAPSAPRADDWNSLLAAMPPPAGIKKGESGGKGVFFSGSPEDMEAWFWSVLQLARAPTYILVDHLDEITDRLHVHPEAAAAGTFQSNGALVPLKPSSLEKTVRQFRLRGVRRMVLPVGQEKDLLALLQKDPLMKGVVDSTHGETRTLRIPRRLAKDQPGLRPSDRELTLWHRYIQGTITNALPEGVERAEDEEWIVLKGPPATLDALAAGIPPVTESMSFHLAANRKELSLGKAAEALEAKPETGAIVRLFGRLRRPPPMFALLLGAAGAAALWALSPDLVPEAASRLTTATAGGWAGAMMLVPFAWGQFMKKTEENPDVRPWLRQWEELPTLDSLREDLGDMAADPSPALNSLFPLLNEAERDKTAGSYPAPEEMLRRLKENPEHLLNYRLGRQMRLPEELLSGLPTDRPLTAPESSRLKAAERLLRHLINKSPEQAGHLFNALHVKKALIPLGKTAWRLLDPALLGEWAAAGQEAGRPREIMRLEQRLGELKTEEAAILKDLALFSAVVQLGTQKGADLLKDAEGLATKAVTLRLRLLNPSATRPEGWQPSLEEALGEIEALLRPAENGEDRLDGPTRAALETAKNQLGRLKATLDLARQDKNPGVSTVNRLEAFMKGVREDRDREAQWIRNLKEPHRSPAPAFFTNPPQLKNLLEETADRFMASLFQENLDAPERIAPLRTAHRAAVKRREQSSEKLFHDLSAMAHLPRVTESLKKTFDPVVQASRRTLQEGLEARGAALLADTVNVYKLFPQAVAESLLEDSADPSPWKVISINIRGLSPDNEKAFAQIVETLTTAQDQGHTVLFLDAAEFIQKGFNEKDLDALLSLWDPRRLPLRIISTPAAHRRLQKKSSLYRKNFPAVHVRFNDQSEHLKTEIAAMGYRRLELAPDAESFLRERTQDIPLLLKALEKAGGRARDSNEKQISRAMLQSSLEDALKESRGQGMDPESYTALLPTLPPQARARAEDILSGIMDAPSRQDQDMPTLDTLFRYPFSIHLPPLGSRTGIDFTDREAFIEAMDRSSLDVIQRLNQKLQDSHLWDPAVLEALVRPITTWIHGQRELDLLQWEIQRIRTAAPNDPGQAERLRALTAQWEESQESLRQSPTFPVLVGPVDVSLQQLKIVATLVMEEMGLTPEEARKKLIVVHLANRDDVALIEGHDDFYLESTPSELNQKILAAGVEDPFVIFHGLDAAGEKVMNAFLPVAETGTNEAIMDRKLRIPFNYGKMRMFFTAGRFENLTGPLQSRLEPIIQPEMTEDRRMKFALMHQIPDIRNGKKITPRQIDFAGEDEARMIIQRLMDSYPDQPLGDKLAILFDSALEDHQTSGEPVILTLSHLDKYRVNLGPPQPRETLMERPSLGIIQGLMVVNGRGILRKFSATLESKNNPDAPVRLGHISESAQKIIGPDMADAARLAWTLAIREAREEKWFSTRLGGKELTPHFHDLKIDKDGSSAGLTLYALYLSALFQKYIRPDVTMTGALDLFGNVLDVEGLEAKAIAARKAGIRLMAVPAANADLEAVLARNPVLRGYIDTLEGDAVVRHMFIPRRRVRPGMSKRETEEMESWTRMRDLLAEEAPRHGLRVEESGLGTVIRGPGQKLTRLYVSLRKESKKTGHPQAAALTAAMTYMDKLAKGITYLRVSHIKDIADNEDIFAKNAGDRRQPMLPTVLAASLGVGGALLLGGLSAFALPAAGASAFALDRLQNVPSSASAQGPAADPAAWPADISSLNAEEQDAVFQSALRVYGHGFSEGSPLRAAVANYLSAPVPENIPILGSVILRPVNGTPWPLSEMNRPLRDDEIAASSIVSAYLRLRLPPRSSPRRPAETAA